MFRPEVIEVFRQEVASILKAKRQEFQPTVRKLQAELKAANKGIEKFLDVILDSDASSSIYTI